MSTTVDVAEGAAMVETTSTDLQPNLDSRQILELPPLWNRTGQLARLNVALAATVAASDSTGQGTALIVDRRRDTNFTIDGVDNNNLMVRGPLVRMPMEATTEFEVSQFSFDLRSGRFAASPYSLLEGFDSADSSWQPVEISVSNGGLAASAVTVADTLPAAPPLVGACWGDIAIRRDASLEPLICSPIRFTADGAVFGSPMSSAYIMVDGGSFVLPGGSGDCEIHALLIGDQENNLTKLFLVIAKNSAEMLNHADYIPVNLLIPDPANLGVYLIPSTPLTADSSIGVPPHISRLRTASSAASRRGELNAALIVRVLSSGGAYLSVTSTVASEQSSGIPNLLRVAGITKMSLPLILTV